MSNNSFLELPVGILNLKKLKVLDLSKNILKELPDEITLLNNLEELNLNNSQLKKLPDLSKLEKIKTFHLSGDSLLSDSLLLELLKMNIPQIEKLFISQWGKQEIYNEKTYNYDLVIRNDLNTLPDEIGNFVNLKEIDISSCGIKKLPDSFYKLKKLEYINLQNNSRLLTSEVIKLMKIFPQAKIDFRNIDINRELKNAKKKQVRTLVKKAKDQFKSDKFESAIKIFNKAIELAEKTNKYTDSDYLYAYYGKIKCYSKFINTEKNENNRKQLISDYENVAIQVLSKINDPILHLMDERVSRYEIFRETYNGLAWYLYKRTTADDTKSLEKALEWANKGAEYVENENHYYILDTQVRILLALNNKEQAYVIVKNILDKTPKYIHFQEIKKNIDYKKWEQTSNEKIFGIMLK